MHVTFVSLFLGLVLGVQPVELAVGPEVAAVELRLDGDLVGRLDRPPWVVPVDLGARLAPRRLEAVARDAEGSELSRALQWLNLPRAQAEAHVVLEGGEDGRGVIARVNWESVVRERPRRLTVRFDGRPLEVADPARFVLPDHDPGRLHLLRVELEFASNLSTVAEQAFGGGYGNETATELTAVPVSVEPPERDLSVDGLAGLLRVGKIPLTPVAAEAGPAEVVLVMDREAQAPLLRLARLWAAEMAVPQWDSRGHSRRIASVSLLRHAMRLHEGQTLRFLWPFTHKADRSADRSRLRYALFARSEDHPPADGGVLWLLTAAQQPAFSADEQRLADAVAVAGMSAAARGRRRAVVLLLGETPSDASQFEPSTVRSYLSALGVPLYVWSVGKASAATEAAWGEVRSVNGEARLRAEVETVARDLDRQRIVWVDGLHLPQEVSLSGQPKGLRLVH